MSSQAKTKKPSQSKKTPSKAPQKNAPVKSGAGCIVGAVIFLLLGVFGAIGYFGNNGAFIGLLSGLLKGLFGWGFYLIPPAMFAFAGFLLVRVKKGAVLRGVCSIFIAAIFGSLLHLFLCAVKYGVSFSNLKPLWTSGQLLRSGGVISGGIAELFIYLFSSVGAGLAFFVLLTIALMCAVNLRPAEILSYFQNRPKRRREEPVPEEAVPFAPPENAAPAKRGRKAKAIDVPLDGTQDEPAPAAETLYNAKPGVKTPDQFLTAIDPSAAPAPINTEDVGLNIPFMEPAAAKPEKRIPADEPVIISAEKGVPAETPKADEPASDGGEEFTAPESSQQPAEYAFPPIDLLAKGSGRKVDGSEEAKINSERLETAFHSYGVNVKIVNFTRGPTVTRYEAELEAGVKLNRLTSLSNDIALSLGASGVRIGAMPGKISTVGIEVPNKLVSMVYLREMIDSQEFKNAPSKLSFAIGKNIGGECIVGNIAKLPHLLVAGTTGSGKSVCLNSLILSILYKSTPEEVRFIMIDPKMVEFRIYNDIPHLLVPVVTDVKKASGALQWAVVEMMKRYRLFSESFTRDLAGYNEAVRQSGEGEPLPQIVVIIDELADLMLTSAREVEESIVRVAQMGRAAGVHLVIATQSPRADVITGLMKANIPSRIAFKVSSALESRIILDAGGNADKLVGNGDMLYSPIGSSKPIRIQGAWVSDEERENVVNFIKSSGEAQYNTDVISEIDKAAEGVAKASAPAAEEAPAENDYDELLPQAVNVIFECGQASVSMLQRRLKLGYSRAARIVDQMEELGIVGPFEGSKPRQILMTRQQWENTPNDGACAEQPASETEETPF